jgi:hypothetical protein
MQPKNGTPHEAGVVIYFYMNILKEIAQIKDNYEGGTIDIIDGLPYSQYETLRKIEFYTNSRYLNGNTDLRNRIKPFYNIINFRINVAVRATDFDTKDFDVYSENPKHYIKSMMFKKEMRNWMRRTNFAAVLNEFGQIRPKYGGAVVKRVKKDGELYVQIPEWKNLITDPVDIEGGVIAERHYMSPVQIEKKRSVWGHLEDEWESIEKVFKKQHGKNYSTADRVCVLEVEGEFPEYYLGNTESDDYCLQRHYILLDQDDSPTAVLHSEKKTQRDYRYLPWQKSSGRALGIGVAEDGFEAQYAVNDALLKEMDIMEIAARTTFWTDSNTIENNLLEDLQTGDILKVKPGETMQVLNTTPTSLPQLDNIREKWDTQYSRATSTFEAVTGETMPSGTPFRAIAIQNQESTALFAYRMEEAGIFWRKIFSEWIVPHLKAKLTREHILSSDFDIDELQTIDEALSTDAANKKVIERAIQGKVTDKEEYEQLLEAEKELLRTNKATRFINIPKDYFKDLEAQVDINITGEQINKGAMFESINNLMVTVSNSFNPQTGTFGVLEDPVLSKMFARAVEMANIGISPAELVGKKAKAQPQQMAPQPQQPVMAEPEPMTV